MNKYAKIFNELIDSLEEYELLSEYETSKKYVKMKHKTCGTIWNVKPNNFKNGSRCPNCINRNNGKNKNKNLKAKKEFNELIDSNPEYELLSEYMNSNSKVKLKHLKCGHIFKMETNKFKQGQRCPNCKYIRINEKLTNNYSKMFQEYIDSLEEYELLSEYVNNYTKVKLKHKTCGYEWNVIPYNLKRGTRCPKCSKGFTKTKKKFYDKINNDKDFILLSEYHGINKYVLMKHIKCDNYIKVQAGTYMNYNTVCCYHCNNGRNAKRLQAKKEFDELINSLSEYELLTKYINVNTKIKIHHKVCGNIWEVLPKNFKKTKCPKCNITKKFLSGKNNFYNFMQQLKEYELLSEYINTKTKVKIKHLKCGHEYNVLPSNLYQGNRCPKCSKSGTSEFEREIQEYVESLISIERNKRFYSSEGKYKYELDIYVPSLNFGIECDGIYWHSELAGGKDKNYHINKQNWFKDKGIDIIFIRDNEWNGNKALVKSFIRNKLKKTKYKIYARKCEIRKIDDKKIVSSFFNKTHLQGGNYVGSINIGLFYKDKLVSLLSFDKSRFNKNCDWELIRFATMKNFIIVGGFSKALSYFKKNYNGILLSYADKRISNGNVYFKNEFELNNISKPGYSYTFDYYNLYNRQKFQKHKLKNVLNYFNEEKTEWENMVENNYDRIWDCGNYVFILEIGKYNNRIKIIN